MSRSVVMTSDTSFQRVAFVLGAVGFGFVLGGCAEPAVLSAPAREPTMRLEDRERVPLPVVAVPTGAATFDRASNASAHEGLSLLPAGRDDAK